MPQYDVDMPPPDITTAVFPPGNFCAPTHSSTWPYNCTLDCAKADDALASKATHAVALRVVFSALLMLVFMDSPVFFKRGCGCAKGELARSRVIVHWIVEPIWARSSLRTIFMDKNVGGYCGYSDLISLVAYRSAIAPAGGLPMRATLASQRTSGANAMLARRRTVSRTCKWAPRRKRPDLTTTGVFPASVFKKVWRRNVTLGGSEARTTEHALAPRSKT